MADLMIDIEYAEWLKDLKDQIKRSQIKAAITVNSQLILLYWDLGRQIVEKQETAKWGSGFIEQLSKDLKKEFPDMTGFSKSNLKNCRLFYKFYSVPLKSQQAVGFLDQNRTNTVTITKKKHDSIENIFRQQLVGELEVNIISLIPWGHHIKIIEKTKNIDEAIFYVKQTCENNWSRAVLEYQIETNLYKRQGKAITNFKLTLPEPESDLANEVIKSEYNFEFLHLSNKAKETDLEKALVQHMAEFLMELGKGFAYMGRQFPIRVGETDFRIDLLFYHTKLRCYNVADISDVHLWRSEIASTIMCLCQEKLL